MTKSIMFSGLMALAIGMNAQTVEKTYFFDFGGQDTGSKNRGTLTTEKGWNNITPSDPSFESIARHTVYSDLVDSNGDPAAGMVLTLTTAWGVNGNSGGGGLMNPDETQLGDLALATATCDYIFNTNNTESGRSFVISGLDKNKGYQFTIFSSRSSNEVRGGNYILSGANSWMSYMQVAGSGLGKNGENYRTGDAPVSDIIFPDAAGNITLWIENSTTTYVPLSCMKMVQYSNAEKPTLTGTVGRTFLFDFGSNVANRGVETTETGWNNILANSGNDCTAGTKFPNLKDSKGNATDVALEVAAKFTTNGLTTGLGLPSPSQAALGDLAVETATYDYFFVDQANASGKFVISGLDNTKTKSYRFHIFASRKATDARLGAYRLEGLNSWTGAMQAAGNALDGETNSQNENVILVSEPIFPDTDGNISLTLINGQKIYLPINCMKIEELGDVERPDIITVMEADLSGSGISEGESTKFMARGKNLFELYVKAAAGEYTITGKDDADGSSTLTATLTDGVNRIIADFDKEGVTVTPVNNFSIEGSTVGGWGPTCQEMDYIGSGVWNFKGELKGYDESDDSGRIGFVINKSWNPTFKRVAGTTDRLTTEGGQDIPLNPGTYDITADLNNMTFSIENGLDDLDPYRVTMMGSSVAHGEGAETVDGYKTGYAYQYDKLLAERYENGDSKNPFYISNISIGGNSSVNLLNRFDDLEREFGKWVIYGISLGNEGIHGASNQESIYNQWKNNMQTLIQKARDLGKEVIVMNNYTRGDFVESDYEYVKKINAEIARWDVPSVNMLGAIDNGKGNWADGYQNGDDIYHPTTAGHTEFFYSMVPSMMDAMLEGKTLTMDRTTDAKYTLPANTTMEFIPEGTVHSFTFAVSADAKDGDLIASIDVDGSESPITLSQAQGKIVALLPDNTVLSVDATNGLDEIELSQNYIRKMISLSVNGKSSEETEFTAVTPTKVTIGDENAENGITLGEVMFYRSSMHDASAFTSDGKLNKSSLEVYVPVAEKLENKAMSTVAVSYNEAESSSIEKPESDKNSFRVSSVTRGTINIFSVAPVRVNVYNISGQTVASAMVEGNVEISGLAAGIYIVNGKKIVVK